MACVCGTSLLMQARSSVLCQPQKAVPCCKGCLQSRADCICAVKAAPRTELRSLKIPFVAFFLCGIGMALPYASVAFQVPYWIEQFGNGIFPQFLAAYNGPGLVVLFAQKAFDEKLDRRIGLHSAYFWRVCIPMFLSFVFTAAVPVIQRADQDGSVNGRTVMLVCLVILGISNACLYGWLFNLAGLLSPQLPPALLGGSGFATAVLLSITVSTKFNNTASIHTVREYFWLASVPPFLALLAFIGLTIGHESIIQFLSEPFLGADDPTSDTEDSSKDRGTTLDQEETAGFLVHFAEELDHPASPGGSRVGGGHHASCPAHSPALNATGPAPVGSSILSLQVDSSNGAEEWDPSAAFLPSPVAPTCSCSSANDSSSAYTGSTKGRPKPPRPRGRTSSRAVIPIRFGSNLDILRAIAVPMCCVVWINTLLTGGSGLSGLMPSAHHNKELPTYLMYAGTLAQFLGNETIVARHVLSTTPRLLLAVCTATVLFASVGTYATTKFYLNDALVLAVVSVFSYVAAYTNASLYRICGNKFAPDQRPKALTFVTMGLYVGVFCGVGFSFALPAIL